MAFRNPNQWIRSVAHGNSNARLLGFRYNPGSGMQSHGIISAYFQFPPGVWVRLHRDAAKVAKAQFGAAVEVSRSMPVEVS